MVTNEEPELSESLAGLVGAFDRLKETMGLDEQAESMLQIESYVSGIQNENEELRRHAEDAILMAQKYKEAYEELSEENDGLIEQLTQEKIGDMVSHAQELTAVAYEYDKEVVLTKVAQAEEMVAHAYAVQERLDELEEENQALKQTLHEIREDQKQMHVLRRLNGTSFGPGDAGLEDGVVNIDECESPAVGSPRSIAEVERTPGGDFDGENDVDAVSHRSVSQCATPENDFHSIHSTLKNDDPLALADALAVVAEGSESGMAASASKMLRGYHGMQAELDELRTRNEALAKENEELTEMMTSKQFKAPSAWAEREVKHKLDQKEWEEQVRTKDATIKELEAENASLRTAQGTTGLQDRIVDLEAQLVASRRECADSKAALHEMQVSSMVSAGEFSMAGVKPLQNHEDVHSIVDKIESESESSAVTGAPGAKRTHELEEELQNLQMEKAGILASLGAIQIEIAKKKVAAAKCEIALLENGVSVEMASKILELEQLEPAVDGESDGDRDATSLMDMKSAAAEVAEAIKEAHHAVSIKGDVEAMNIIKGLRVTSHVEGMDDASDAVEGAGEEDNVESKPQEVSQDALERIAQLEADIEELSVVAESEPSDFKHDSNVTGSASPGTERLMQGIQPRAAAALAAMNRAQERDIENLKRQLADTTMREADLQQQLLVPAKSTGSPLKPPPIRLDLNIATTPGKTPDASTASSTMTQMISPGGLALARKDADQAWEDHQKKTDISAILREKAQIEAKFDVTKSQLTKSQQALDMARQDATAMRKAIKQAIATGDVKAVQKALDEVTKSSSLKKVSSPLKRLKGRGIFSLKKSNSGTGSNSSSRPSSGETDEKSKGANLRLKTPTGAGSTTPGRDKFEDDDVHVSREIENLTDENEMLMDQLVTTKVRLAEVEGDCLQSRRALVRAREKQMDLMKQLKDIRAGPLERG